MPSIPSRLVALASLVSLASPVGALAAVGGAGLAALATGCAGDPAADADGEDTAASEEELGRYSTAIVGTYTARLGGRPPTFERLVLGADGSFHAEIDTGIRCVRAPCPSHVSLAGRYTAYKKTLKLRPFDGEAPADFHGSYGYELAEDGALALTSAALPGWTTGLARVPGIWDASSTALVARSAGGGFVPQGPEGSTCTWGQSTYHYDRASRVARYEVCAQARAGAPLAFATGQRTLSLAAAARVELAARAASVSANDFCGADKPMLTVDVSSAAGTRAYTDSFYSCMEGDHVFVDGLDAIVAALRDATR